MQTTEPTNNVFMHLWLFGKTHHKTVEHESSAPTLFKNRELSVVNFPVFLTLRIINLNEEKKIMFLRWGLNPHHLKLYKNKEN